MPDFWNRGIFDIIDHLILFQPVVSHNIRFSIPTNKS